jgi:hypothetical protein
MLNLTHHAIGMRSSLLAHCVAVVIVAQSSACGDGGGVAKDLSPYVATWQAPCSDHVLGTLTVRASASTDTLELETGTEYYDLPSCAGAVVATLRRTPAATATFGGEDEGPLRGPRPGETIIVRFDRFTVATPVQTTSVVGPTVRVVGAPGTRGWCFDHSSGTSCVEDPGAQQATVRELDLLLSASQLSVLTFDGSLYERSAPYTRR